MQQRIRELLTPARLAEAADRYDAKPAQLSILGAFDSFIFALQLDDGPRILRLSHGATRSADLVRGELDWIQHLVVGGASVCAPLPSPGGELIERIDDGEGDEFLATAFEHAAGVSPGFRDWNGPLIGQYGELLGRTHALSADYAPREERWRRPHSDDPVMLDVEQVLAREDPDMGVVFHEVMARIAPLSREGRDYGLVHQDAHGENLKVDGDGRIRLFDFYDCAYSWYVNDIAIVLFYVVLAAPDPARFAARFMPHFLAGYRRAAPFDAASLEQIPLFLKLREVDLYAVILREFGDDWHSDPWTRRFMTGRRERLLGDVPTIDFDFRRLG